MRILMISDVYFPRVNGVSTSIQTFARTFTATGHSITLIAPDYGQIIRDPFNVVRIPAHYLPFDPEDRVLHWRQLWRYATQLPSGQFDLIHVHTPFIAHYFGVRLARHLNIPVVESYHTFFEQYLNHYVPLLPAASLRWIARHFSRTQCNAVDGLIVPSQAMLQVLRDYGIHTQAAVVPTGIDLTQFQPGNGQRFRQAHGIAPERPLLIHVGRLAFEKNVEFLLRLLPLVRAKIPNVLLAIAGEGPARAALQTLVAQLGLNQHVCFVGYLARDGALEDCYCAGDAFIFASRTETQGLVLLEALAMGTPVISTAVMGTREVLAENGGCLIAADDENAFAAQVVRLLQNRQLRATLSAQAIQYVQQWSAAALAQRMIDFYQHIVTTRAR